MCGETRTHRECMDITRALRCGGCDELPGRAAQRPHCYRHPDAVFPKPVVPGGRHVHECCRQQPNNCFWEDRRTEDRRQEEDRRSEHPAELGASEGDFP